MPKPICVQPVGPTRNFRDPGLKAMFRCGVGRTTKMVEITGERYLPMRMNWRSWPAYLWNRIRNLVVTELYDVNCGTHLESK